MKWVEVEVGGCVIVRTDRMRNGMVCVCLWWLGISDVCDCMDGD